MDIEYQLKKVKISSISNNKYLGITIHEEDIDRCVKTMRNYGLLTPIVVGKINDEREVVLSGQCEINAMREMKISETSAIIVDCNDNTEASKLALVISSLRQQPSAVSEGLLISELVFSKNLKQRDIAHLVGKSESWVAKRLALVQKLSDPVIDMVMNKHICSRTAEEISRLPEDVQTNFAQKVVSANLPKSKVEQLVMMYNNPSTSTNIKNIILEKPQDAASILIKKNEKLPGKPLEDSDSKNLSLIKTSISIIIRAIADFESNVHHIPIEKIQGQINLLSSCIYSSERFTKLLLELTKKLSPGKV